MISATKTKLNHIKSYQIDIYNNIKHQFVEIYNSIQQDTDQILPFWKNINNSVLRKFNPYPPFNYLATQEIIDTMYSTNVDAAKDQLKYLEEIWPEYRLKTLLEEELIGDPLILSDKYLASCNTIHHLYHYERFINKTNGTNSTLRNIVEFGSGYGHFAKMFNLLYFDESLTYTIIDIPVFTSIQWLYLSCCIGVDKVNLIKNTNKIEIKEGMVNLIPTHRINEFANSNKKEVDLFIAMWSLSEGSEKSQDIMEETDFFAAKNIFLALHSNKCQTLPNGNRLYNFVKDKYQLDPTDYVDQHYYCFK